MRNTFTIAAILLVALTAVGIYASRGTPSLGNVAYETRDFLEGVYAGAAREFTITRTGSTTVPAFRVDAGSYINEWNCNTNSSYNPPSLVTNGTTTVDIALTGAALGDVCGDVSLTSATSSGPYLMSCAVTGSATGTVSIVNLSGATVDNATGTLRACYRSY